MCTRPAKPRKPAPRIALGAALTAALIFSSAAEAGPPATGKAGQTWRVFPDASAASRDYLGRAQVRAVVWYPAAAGVVEKPIAIGPPGAETFSGGLAAPEAAWAKGGKHPLIVMSHGSGGTALQYGWLGSELAKRGYVVIAVDHPGASGGERATDSGARDWYLRPNDISAAISGALADPVLSRRIDRKRIGLVGYSLGGATALQLAGVRLDLSALAASAGPDASYSDMMDRIRQMGPGGDGRIAAFALIAPAVLSALDLTAEIPSLPMLVVAGDADVTVKPDDNAARIARSVEGAQLQLLPGVTHNDFLQVCTAAGRARYADLCKEPDAQREATHARAAGLIAEFFEGALKAVR